MTRLLVCAFAAPVFVLAILAGGFDRAATAAPVGTPSLCQACIKNCKGGSICIAHCESRGCRSRGGPAVESLSVKRRGGLSTGPTHQPAPPHPARAQ
jgi:hypothetical protein